MLVIQNLFCLLTQGIPTPTLKPKHRLINVTSCTLSGKKDVMVEQQTGLNAFSSGEKVPKKLAFFFFFDNALRLEFELWVHMEETDGAGAMCLFSHWCLMPSVTGAVLMQLAKGTLNLGYSLSGW